MNMIVALLPQDFIQFHMIYELIMGVSLTVQAMGICGMTYKTLLKQTKKALFKTRLTVAREVKKIWRE